MGQSAADPTSGADAPPLAHMVFFTNPAGSVAAERHASLAAAVARVEALANDDDVQDAEVFALTPVRLQVRQRWLVEVPTGPTADQPSTVPAVTAPPAAVRDLPAGIPAPPSAPPAVASVELPDEHRVDDAAEPDAGFDPEIADGAAPDADLHRHLAADPPSHTDTELHSDTQTAVHDELGSDLDSGLETAPDGAAAHTSEPADDVLPTVPAPRGRGISFFVH